MKDGTYSDSNEYTIQSIPCNSTELTQPLYPSSYLTDGRRPRIADAEPLGRLTAEESLSRRGAIQDDVTDNDVVVRLERFRQTFRRIDDQFTTTETLQQK